MAEWKRSEHIAPEWRQGKYNVSDLLTKASTPQDIIRLLLQFLGYDLEPTENVEKEKSGERQTKRAKTA